MKRRRRRRRNPDGITYWAVLAAIVAGGIAVWAWGAMSDRAKRGALPIGQKPNDVPIGGPWTMLDVAFRGRSSVSAERRAALKRGDIVTVDLTAGAGFNMPYVVTVLGPTGRGDLPFAGAWALRAPPAGPQMIDFGPEHVFTIV